MISVDPINHGISVDANSVMLQPLTYDLLVRLLKNKNETVTIDQLTSEVWEGVVVSPDTLKQRIFLLRKALEEAAIDPSIIQSIRGKGYRLVYPLKMQETAISRISLKGKLLIVGFFVAAVIGLWKGKNALQYELPANNRVVFWTESTMENPNEKVEELKQTWLNILSSNEEINFIASTMALGKDMSTRARSVRTGLISYWSIFEAGDSVSIRLQIIEPKTATVLRSDVISLNNFNKIAPTLQIQLDTNPT